MYQVILSELTDKPRGLMEEEAVKSIQHIIKVELLQGGWSFMIHVLGKS